MPQSLFGRLARHLPTPGRDPREDRLTEVFAAVMAASGNTDLARHIALAWLTCEAATVTTVCARLGAIAEILRTPQDWRLEVCTQRFLNGPTPRRVDLDLAFFAATDDDVEPAATLWVEVKHGTPPHTGQLRAYEEAQHRRRLRNAAVFLLAPRADLPGFPKSEVPTTVPSITWEDTGRTLAAFKPHDAVEAFLIAELIAYLREEMLMDPPEITTDHLSALQHYTEGVKALVRIAELAGSRIANLWDGVAHHGTYPEQRGSPREYWWVYPARAADGNRFINGPTTSEPTFGLLLDSSDVLPDGRPGVPLLFAGLVWEGSRMDRVPYATLARCQEAEFRALPRGANRSRRNEYLIQTSYPKDLFAGGALDHEADALASWVNRAFAELAVATNL